MDTKEKKMFGFLKRKTAVSGVPTLQHFSQETEMPSVDEIIQSPIDRVDLWVQLETPDKVESLYIDLLNHNQLLNRQKRTLEQQLLASKQHLNTILHQRQDLVVLGLDDDIESRLLNHEISFREARAEQDTRRGKATPVR